LSSPTALNRRGKKIELDGYTFDSEKEANFYLRFLKGQVPQEQLSVHPHFVLAEKKAIKQGVNVNSIRYTPDFIVYDKFMNVLHIYDVKNSLGDYGIDNGNRLTFRLFAMNQGVPVEAVSILAHSFRSVAVGVTKPLNGKWSFNKAKRGIKQSGKPPIERRDVWYNWKEATNY
jgi:hypothetical protein